MSLRSWVALLWLIGLLTMHGVSVHHGDATAERPAAATVLGMIAFSPVESADMGGPLDDEHGDHGDHGHAPCPQCAHQGSPCASAVTVATADGPQPRVAVIQHTAWQGCALVRLWSPDPPVPRLALAPRPS